MVKRILSEFIQAFYFPLLIVDHEIWCFGAFGAAGAEEFYMTFWDAMEHEDIDNFHLAFRWTGTEFDFYEDFCCGH